MSNMIRGIASWAFLTVPNTKWEEPRFELTLEVSKEIYDDYTKLVSFGHSIKDGKYLIKLHTPALDKLGNPEPPPELVDAAAQPTAALVGNGSEVIAKYRTFTYTKGRAIGKTRSFLEGIQIVKLVEYVPEGGTSGFTPCSPSPH